MNPNTIKTYRNARGWSLKRLAKDMGVSKTTIGRWESGQTEPSPEAVEKLKIIMGIT
jgi:transcriptional regulator with XRE-family HTH domain